MLNDSQLDTLAEKGYLFAEGLVPEKVWQPLQQELLSLVSNKKLTPAGVGKNATQQSEIRSDFIQWLEPAPETKSPAQTAWLEWVTQLRQQLNQTLYLGANDYEGHLAQYPKDSFYKPHLDQHKGKNTRRLTVILYLNETWKPEHAGELKFYPDDKLGVAGESFCVTPTAGKIALFQSDRFWHEVLPSKHSRLSLTGWLLNK